MPDGTLPPDIASRDARRGSVDTPADPSQVIGSGRSNGTGVRERSVAQQLMNNEVRVISFNCPMCPGVGFQGRGRGGQAVFNAAYLLCQHMIDEHQAVPPEDEG